MMKELKNSFMQAGFGTLLWISLLGMLFIGNQTIRVFDLWRVMGIGTIAALVFGIVYPYLWNYSTFKASTNILISTIFNVTAGFSCLYLFSPEMFKMVFPFSWAVVILTLVGHIIGFYFYSKVENKKIADELNGRIG